MCMCSVEFFCMLWIFLLFIDVFVLFFFFFFQAEDGIRDWSVTGVQTCALPICALKEQELTARGGPPQTRTPASSASSPPLSPVAKLIPAPSPGASLSDNSIPGKTGPAQLRWEGPASARAGASFNVSLRVTSGDEIRAAPMQLRFDPAVLESVSVRPGRYFSADKTGSVGYSVNTDGSSFFGVCEYSAASPY